jgi:nitroreductase
MELDACIKGRRSVRSYTSEPVSKEQIEAILEAGTWAPNGIGNEPWRFVVIQDKGLIKYVSDETKSLLIQKKHLFAEQYARTDKDTICYNAPVLILVCVEKSLEFFDELTDMYFTDCVLAAQNMFLKAYELGLGTCFMGLVFLLKERPEVLKKVGVPENYEMMVPLILGHPKTQRGTGRRKKPNILKWIH